MIRLYEIVHSKKNPNDDIRIVRFKMDKITLDSINSINLLLFYYYILIKVNNDN